MSAFRLRQILMNYLVANTKLIIKGIPMCRWVLWDALQKKKETGNNQYGIGIDTDMNEDLTDGQMNALVRSYAKKIICGMWEGGRVYSDVNINLTCLTTTKCSRP
jgi:hypothetical protein